MRMIFCLAVSLLIAFGCAHSPPSKPPIPKLPCHIVYDAGSGGTRLFIYEENGWVIHKGPQKLPKLASPLLTNADSAETKQTVIKIVDALEQIKTASPNQWDRFDWEDKCTVKSVSVLATAGMRLAEQIYPYKSKELWQFLKTEIEKKIPTPSSNVRTITGFEEGLYDWLAVRDEKDVTIENFGIAASGGMSSQVTFPCPQKLCPSARLIHLGKNKSEYIYSYSFFGIGGATLPQSLIFPSPAPCIFGTKKATECATKMKNFAVSGDIKDPNNYSAQRKRNSSTAIPENPNLAKWYLTGGTFEFMNKFGNDIEKCCQEGNSDHCKFRPESSCFRAVYLDEYLKSLDIPAASEKKIEINWTKGAVICAANNCLRDAKPTLECRWLPTLTCINAP